MQPAEGPGVGHAVLRHAVCRCDTSPLALSVDSACVRAYTPRLAEEARGNIYCDASL